MEKLDKWAAVLFGPQIVFGYLVYNWVDGHALASAVFVAGVWAAIVMLVAAIFFCDKVKVMISLASLMALWAVFAIKVPFLAITLGLCSIGLIVGAAAAAKSSGGGTFLRSMLHASPIGAAVYLFNLPSKILRKKW